MKISTVLTNSSVGIVGQIDNTATKAVLTAMDAASSCKQEIIMAGVGLALGALGDSLALDMEFMSGAIDGQLDITDIGLMADEIGMGIVGLAALTASQKMSKKFEELSVIDTMNDEEFETYLATNVVKKKAVAEETVVKEEFIELLNTNLN